jgi:hypothetical protein
MTTSGQLDERAAVIRTDVNGTSCVKLSRGAFDRQAAFRNTTANHLLSQVLGYRPAAPEAAQELLSAFCTGVYITAVRS